MKNIKFYHFRLGIIVAAIASTLALFLFSSCDGSRAELSPFIDTRVFFGVPNAMDVFSNIFFALTGMIGIWEVIKRQPALVTKKSWAWFFISILLIAPGSAYYHLAPNDSTLIWDRLPMSMGFMALYIVLLCEHLSMKFEKFLHLALAVGLISVLTWVVTADLRFYFWVQFSSFITIPLILLLFPSRYTLKAYYFVCLAIYGLAKWAEVKDKEIFIGTENLLSGHTLKHLLAAIGLLALWWMVRTRKVVELQASPAGSVSDATGKLQQAP